MAKKNKNQRKELITKDSFVTYTEQEVRDKVFLHNLPDIKWKHFAAIIYSCVRDGMSDEAISVLTGLTESQIQLVKQTPEFYESIHNLIDKDNEFTKTMLRPHKAKVIKELLKQIETGDTKAMKMYFDLCDKETDNTDTFQKSFVEFAEQIGLITVDSKRTSKLHKLKQDEENEAAASSKGTEALFKLLMEDTEEDEEEAPDEVSEAPEDDDEPEDDPMEEDDELFGDLEAEFDEEF